MAKVKPKSKARASKNGAPKSTAAATPRAFANRIKEYREIPAGQIVKNHKNWAVHTPGQREALNAMLGRVGWAGAAAVFINESGQYELIDGELRDDAALGASADEPVPCLILDVDRAEADLLLGTINTIGMMVETNRAAAERLVAEIIAAQPDMTELMRTAFEAAKLPSFVVAPADFPVVDPAATTNHRCPKCGYEFN